LAVSRSKKGRRPGSSNRVRIIGGDWGGQQLSFPDAEGLRPTSDRIRETVFNWLQFHLAGRSVLDTFAGSGALGFEAASRAASRVLMLEKSKRVASVLEENRQKLGAEQIQVINRDAWNYLSDADEQFDVVFLDPPFGKDMIEGFADLLEERGLLSDEAMIYLEMESTLSPRLPSSWEVIRDKKAGDVRYMLARRFQQ
jgi:16S rRNA (guanine966-N2)-methyltransferase